MLLMLLALNFELVRRPVVAAADALLSHLSLLFVPVGVGVIAHLSLLSQFGLRLAVVVVLSTLLGIAATALLLRQLWRRAALSAMDKFVELWVYLSATPLFGLTATLATYVVACAFYDRLQQAPWANPVLWTVLTLVALLAISDTSYPTYFAGAQFIHFLLGPAVVALAWPLWQRRAELRRRAGALLLSSLVGGLVAAGSAVALGWALGLPHDLLRSLAPKSVTAPVAMGIAEQLGGIPALAAVFAVLTGLVGALGAKYLFDALRVADSEIRGFALGTVSHGIGAARAMQVHPDAGAYAGLALGTQVVLSTLLLSLLSRLF